MEGLSQNEKIIWSCWDEKSPRDVVREAAAKGNHISLAVKYLMTKNSWSETVANEWFLAEVKSWTVQLLQRKQIFKVLHILGKACINPELHLMTLALESPEIVYRDFIVDQLEKISNDIQTDNISKWEDFKKHWNLLRYLEKSFEMDGTFKQNKVFGVGKERIFVNETEIKALTIDKIMKYPMQWKSTIATTLFFDSFEFSLLDFSTSVQIWNHLVQHNKAMILIRWINVQTSKVVRDMNARYNFFNNEGFVKKLLNIDTKGFYREALNKLDDVFRTWPITGEMIDSVASSNCYAFTKMCIYDTLCSYGIVNNDEKSNLYNIVARLARTQNLKIVDEIFNETCSTISKEHFYVELAKYCVRNQLYNVLTMCIESNILLESDLSDVDQEARECIELWLLFKSIEQTSDRQSHVVPVYKTCHQITKNDVDNYITSNPHLVLGMILLEDNAKLFDIFSNQDFLQFKDFRLPNKGYKNQLPHLYSVYKKYTDVNYVFDSKDVNVYQLLSDYQGLDVSKIFEFQIVNQNTSNMINDKPDRRSLGSLMSSDVDVSPSIIKTFTCPQKEMDMPDFANEKLMKRYGYVAKLNHVYYLKQYRPCNASQAFVAQQYQTYNRLHDKCIKSACCEAHALALENWTDAAMTACAVSFVAMIGCNPARCRVHMSAAKMIKQYLIANKGLTEDKAGKTVNDYMSKMIESNDEAAEEVLRRLEEITLHKINETQESEGKLDMATVLYESQAMVKFAALHDLKLPEMLLKEFVKKDMWFNFLLFGDVFRYPVSQMLQLCQDFGKKSYAEHLKYIMLHRNAEDGSDKDFKIGSSNGQRRISRLNSVEVQTAAQTPPAAEPWSGRELWEAAAACHGPEDPPAALLRAAIAAGEPLLVLVATCYEPSAVDVFWVHWVLASLPASARGAEADAPRGPAVDQFQRVAELCLREGYVGTLHESMVIFMPESPLTLLTSFLYRCIRLRNFDTATCKLLSSFLQHCQRKYSVDSSASPIQMSKEAMQKVAVSLVKISLSQCFDSACHQREFLKSLSTAQFDKGLSVPSPNFGMMCEILQISMETSLVVNISKMLHADAEQYLTQCVEMHTANRNYDVALKIAKLAKLPVNDILLAEWSHKYEMLQMKEEAVEDKDMTLFVAQCSEAFKKASVSFSRATEFLVGYICGILDTVQRFYCYRVVMSWFEEHLEYGRRREEIEHLMWDAYFQSEYQPEIFLNSYPSTLHYILTGQKDANLSRKIGLVTAEKPFSMTLAEIEIQSDVGNIETVVQLEDLEAVDNWKRVINQLLELKLLVEGFRLSALFRAPPEFRHRPACPAQIVRTCLRLAEETISPYELPQELRLVISSSFLQSKLSLGSEASDASFEELVVIPEAGAAAAGAGAGAGAEGAGHLAAREEADRLAALDALAVRSGLTVAKQVASYFRIALQIGWSYGAVLSHGNCAEFISQVSGRARLPLAGLVFRTFNIPSKQVAEYLCREMVTSIISPHLVKTSTFRQKEHFQYTLWGYTLNSDIEMFLNMRPDACSQIGRLILDHLMAFQKIYKATTVPSKVPENTFDDSNLDVETLIDEEYQTVEGDEESIVTEEGTLMSADTESVFSVSTVYTVGGKMTRDTRRNLFDAITRKDVQIRYEVKSNIRKITKGAKLSTKQVNIISIELLVLAHECVSCACDTEGVAVAVVSAQALAQRLLAARSWRLMVRLLCGLGRYADTAYIFQALRDNQQFEFLLGQFDYMLGSQPERIAEFKQGLLDYLRTHCPGDTDACVMVALHFNMYSEAADVRKKQALGLIADLEKMATEAARAAARLPRGAPPPWPVLHDTPQTRLVLDAALAHCTDAAEWYLQGGGLGLAGDMASLAALVALQLSLLAASPTRLILNRTTDQMYKLVTEYLSFMEGLVLLSGRNGEAWRELAYRRALTNDQAYLRDMAAYRPDVAYEFLNRFKNEKTKTPVAQLAMSELRSLCR